MEIKVSVDDIIVMAGSLLSLILAISFFIRRSNKDNAIMAAFLFVCFARLFLKFLDEADLIIRYPHFSRWNHVFGLLTPPLFYLYFRYFNEAKKRFRKVDWLHFAVPLSLAAYLLPYFLLSAADKREVLAGLQPENSVLLPSWMAYAGLVYSLAYLVAVKMLFFGSSARRFEKPAEARVWLYMLLIGYDLFMILSIVDLSSVSDYNLNYLMFKILSVSIIIAGIRLLSIPNPVNAPPVKYRNSPIGEARKAQLLAALEHLMQQEKIYRDPDIRLPGVAAKLGVTENELSQLINDALNSSFSDYINGFRVASAKDLLLDPSYNHLSIEGIAYEAGFASRTSFYTAFKAVVGSTPSSFKQKNSV